MHTHYRLLILLLVIIVTGACTPAEQATSEETSAPATSIETIVFSDLNWSSAQVQNRVAQYIVEKGYGYSTDVVFGSTLLYSRALHNGDTHVTLEIWLPNRSRPGMRRWPMRRLLKSAPAWAKTGSQLSSSPNISRTSTLNWTASRT